MDKKQTVGGSARQRLLTWGRESTFEYTGSVEQGTAIYYGEKGKIILPSDLYKELLQHFDGQKVLLGNSAKEDAPAGSLGEWLFGRRQTRIVSYVAPILVANGYAVSSGDHIKITKVPKVINHSGGD